MFEYHDGRVNAGTKGLENQLGRADMVLRPIDCNSHGAASAVKRLGKKYQKPVRMLANSRLSTVSHALSSLREGNGK
jgi:hypothetical protein